MIDADMLRGIDIFDGLTAGELKYISEICRIVKLKRGARILTRGDIAKDLYVVKSGKVNLCLQVPVLLADKEIVVDIKSVGDVFGWSALVEPHELTLSAYCDEGCELIQMRGKEILSLCANKHHLGYILFGNLAKIIRQSTKDAEIILLKVNHPYFLKFDFSNGSLIFLCVLCDLCGKFFSTFPGGR